MFRWSLGVIQAVNQENRRGGPGDSGFGGRSPKVQTVAQARINKCRPNNWGREPSADFVWQRQPFGKTISGQQFQVREGTLGDNRTEAWFHCQRLDQDRTAERFAQSKNPLRMLF